MPLLSLFSAVLKKRRSEKRYIKPEMKQEEKYLKTLRYSITENVDTGILETSVLLTLRTK